MTAKPCLKWPGGKSTSVVRILRNMPKKIRTYYEPCVGGGAVFFALANEGRFERAVLSDTNQELIDTYRAIKVDVDGVIQAIRRLNPAGCTEEQYYKVRASKPRRLTSIAARMLFLNKTCFNGLYRVNQAGEFNAPWGKRTWEPDYQALRDAARALRNTILLWRSFTSGTLGAETGDVVYIDPPYLPVKKTSFTAYAREGFGVNEHLALGREFALLAAKGVTVLASNSYCRESLAIYRAIPETVIRKFGVRRNINRDGDGRAKVKEILAVHRGVELS